MPTIDDIAKKAGVSHGTVSNVLNNTGKVRSKTVRRIKEAMRSLDYKPNPQARSLRQGASRKVALILPSIESDGYLNLYTTIQRELLAHRYELSLFTTDDVDGQEESLFLNSQLMSYSAIITISSISNAAEKYASLNLPIIFVNRDYGDKCTDHMSISFDFSQVGKDLAQYVLDHGWKKIAFFASLKERPDDLMVFNALHDVLDASGVSVRRFSSDYSLAVNKAFDILIQDDFDAVITANTQRAKAIFTALKFWDRQHSPKIITLGSQEALPSHYFTTYELDYRQMGRIIANAILDHLEKNEVFNKNAVRLPALGFRFQPSVSVKAATQELTMLALESPTLSALEKILPFFERQTGIHVKITSFNYQDAYDQLTLIDSDYFYDLIRMDVAWLDVLAEKIYLPLEKAGVFQNSALCSLADTFVNFSETNGIRYTLPFDSSALILLYRCDLFEDDIIQREYYERYHETLCIPTDFVQFRRVSEFFTKSANSSSPTPYGTATTCGVAYSATCDFLPHLLARSGSLVDASGKVCFKSPEMRAAMEEYKDLYNTVGRIRSSWWDETITRFSDANCAMVIAFSNHVSPVINSKHSIVAGKVRAAVIPGGHPILGGGTLGISRYSKNVDACAQFFNWYYDYNTAAALVRLGGTSPVINDDNSYENHTLFPWMAAEKESCLIGTRRLPQQTGYNLGTRFCEYILGSALQNVLNGSMTVDSAIQYAQMCYDKQSL